MRKRGKLKKRSCALCKPHKMKWDNRWKHKEHISLKVWEKDKAQILKNHPIPNDS
jgi:hypothetical protein